MLNRAISSIVSTHWFARAARTLHHLTATPAATALTMSNNGTSTDHDTSSATAKAAAAASSAWTRDHGAFTVTLVPLFNDNYSYVLMEKSSRQCAWIDPADPTTVLKRWKAIEEENLADRGRPTWTHIFSTHKHWDHAGGNIDLAASLPHLQIVGGAHDGIPACTTPVEDGQIVPFGDSLQLRVLHVPCHTSGHVLYHVTERASESDAPPHSCPGVLFTGDTLFVAGCGKFFEGTAKEMYRNLFDVMHTLPDDVVTYCGHEYTVSNLQFATWVEPENPDVKAKLEWAIDRRSHGLPTVGTTLQEERLFNPFMRVHISEVQTRVQSFILPSAGASDASSRLISVLQAVREAKNRNAHVS